MQKQENQIRFLMLQTRRWSQIENRLQQVPRPNQTHIVRHLSTKLLPILPVVKEFTNQSECTKECSHDGHGDWQNAELILTEKVLRLRAVLFCSQKAVVDADESVDDEDCNNQQVIPRNKPVVRFRVEDHTVAGQG